MESFTPPRTYTANELRALAESADGLRDRTLAVTVNARGELALEELPEDTAPAPHQIVMHTASGAPGKPQPQQVTLTHPNGAAIDVSPEEFDAICWSEAACEKFLIPYYVRFYDEAKLAKLRRAIASAEVIAIGHRRPTIWVEITDQDPQLLLANPQPGLLPGWVPLSAWEPAP